MLTTTIRVARNGTLHTSRRHPAIATASATAPNRRLKSVAAGLCLLVTGAILVWSLLAAWRVSCFVNDTGPLGFAGPSNPVAIGRDVQRGHSVLLYGSIVNRSAHWATLTGFETTQCWGPQPSWLGVVGVYLLLPDGSMEPMSFCKPRVPPKGSVPFVVKAELLDVPHELLHTTIIGASCRYSWMGIGLSALSQVPWIVQPSGP